MKMKKNTQSPVKAILWLTFVLVPLAAFAEDTYLAGVPFGDGYTVEVKVNNTLATRETGAVFVDNTDGSPFVEAGLRDDHYVGMNPFGRSAFPLVTPGKLRMGSLTYTGEGKASVTVKHSGGEFDLPFIAPRSEFILDGTQDLWVAVMNADGADAVTVELVDPSTPTGRSNMAVSTATLRIGTGATEFIELGKLFPGMKPGTLRLTSNGRFVINPIRVSGSNRIPVPVQ